MSIEQVWTHCDPCQGTGTRGTAGGGGGEQCQYCEGTGKMLAHTLDSDLIDKLNDMEDKINDIFELVSP